MATTDNKKELVDYFKKNLKKGYTAESLKTALIQQGYPRARIDQSVEIANKELARTAPIIREKPVITHEVYDGNNIIIEPEESFFKRLIRKFSSR